MPVKGSIRLLAFFTALGMSMACARSTFAREVVVPLFGGVVYADGRPIEKSIMVRFEAENSALIATTYTLDSGRFLFRNTIINYEDSYLLVIREPEYKEMRYRLERNYFTQDSASPNIVHSGGTINLELESLPPERTGRRKDSKAVDVRQLQADISDKARREFKLAQEELAAGRRKDGISHLKRAVELSPEYFDALARLGLEYMKDGQPKEAKSALKRATTLNPNDPSPLTNLGILQYEEGEKLNAGGAGDAAAAEKSYRNAAELFEKALLLGALAGRPHLYLGMSHYKLGSYDKAESFLLNAMVLDRGLHEARLALINIYSRQQRYEEALRQIAEYLQANPNSPEKKQLEGLRVRLEGVLAKQ